jgi:hypothetical protein
LVSLPRGVGYVEYRRGVVISLLKGICIVQSQLRFVMHPDDELCLLQELFLDQDVLLIDGPRWRSQEPVRTRDISQIARYCIIWSPKDLAKLSAEYMPACHDWVCRSGSATIQFLRSTISQTTISDGRLAIGTDPDQASAIGVERRYKALSKFIKKSYANSVVQWRNPEFPEHPATPTRSANPSKPDRSLWVGPAAMTWFVARSDRHVRPWHGGGVVGKITPRD